MTKVVSISLGFMLTLAAVCVAPAQSSPTDTAVNEAVLRQANTILLRQKLADASNAAARGDLNGAAKFYEDAYQLVAKIGSGIDAEKAQTIAGLTSTRMQLARNAQQQGDLRGADIQVTRVLKVNPQNAAAIAFKKQNDRMIAAMRGQVPDDTTLQQIPAIENDKMDADTLVRDGQVLYEMGKLEEAEVKLRQALKLDPDNKGAFYYLNLVKQASYKRSEDVQTVDDATRIVQVAKAMEIPTGKMQLPVPNPYASSDLVHTGPGREAIINKLERIRLDSVSYDGLPLSEVVRNLSEQAKLRDPDKKGINFLIDPNVPAPVTTTTPTTTGPGQFNRGAAAQPASVQIDPNTGLPITAGTGGGGEQVDINSVVVKINPPLTDVSLADVLDAIVKVADHPIKYSIEDYAIVFSLKGPDEPQLFSRSFKVDPNTFYQGLQGVSAFSFGSANNNGSGGSGGGGGGGSSGGGSGQNQGGAVVPVVNVAPGSSGLRSTGNGGGGGGGGGGGQGGQNNGGVAFVTTTNSTVDVSVAARNFFDTLGVDLDPPKNIFFNDRLGILYVRATMQDLDTIENAIQSLNEVAPQIHIKARFIEVDQGDNKGLGFDWYLGQFNLGNQIVSQGGSAPSLNTTPSAANPSGVFPGNTFDGTSILGSTADQLVSSGLNNAGIPTVATLTGILTDPNFRVVLHALEQRTGAEELAEPEVTTTSGRQTEMRATQIITVITGFNYQQGAAGTTTGTGQ
jgi:tetratricopeptide (TPR) repeat protein